ncbi:suppressor of fused domain protein [Eleftheria terrae]|uniref:suppressor of fused domain protein n=1 Tax=Eleftheria terrae TaxID=1597781 RepID=UPI00263B14D1|nr:suppressor of fused domain protein [Eleftheria terrae]WKB55948.1 suppressor of fused domain protein [Eleftheria terrae]
MRDLERTEASATPLAPARRAAMTAALGDPHLVDADPDRSQPIDIFVFERNFIEECDDDADDDPGYVLVTSGMSDQLMTLPDEGADDASPAVELVWYVRDLNPEYLANLRWLAKLPFIDATWFAMGHTIAMPRPPLSFCEFSAFLLLPPIIRTDRELFEDLEQQGHPIETLTVHLLSEPEYRLVKTEDGLDEFLDLLDEHDYPLIFDPARASIVEP